MAPLEKAPPAANVIDAGCSNGLNYPTVIPLHIDDPTPTLPIESSWNSSTWPGILDYLLPRCRMVVEDCKIMACVAGSQSRNAEKSNYTEMGLQDETLFTH